MLCDEVWSIYTGVIVNYVVTQPYMTVKTSHLVLLSWSSLQTD